MTAAPLMQLYRKRPRPAAPGRGQPEGALISFEISDIQELSKSYRFVNLGACRTPGALATILIVSAFEDRLGSWALEAMTQLSKHLLVLAGRDADTLRRILVDFVSQRSD